MVFHHCICWKDLLMPLYVKFNIVQISATDFLAGAYAICRTKAVKLHNFCGLNVRYPCFQIANTEYSMWHKVCGT